MCEYFDKKRKADFVEKKKKIEDSGGEENEEEDQDQAEKEKEKDSILESARPMGEASQQNKKKKKEKLELHDTFGDLFSDDSDEEEARTDKKAQWTEGSQCQLM